ncbi:hypothetical protein [Streptomyces decoyicus]
MTAPGRAPMDWLLTTTAHRLPTGSPNATLTEAHLTLIAELTIWDWHGTADPDENSIADARALRDELDRIPIDGATRDEYAARLHLAAKGVRL